MYTNPSHHQPVVTAIITQIVERMKFTHALALACYEMLSSQRMKSNLIELKIIRTGKGRPKRSIIELMMKKSVIVEMNFASKEAF